MDCSSALRRVFAFSLAMGSAVAQQSTAVTSVRHWSLQNSTRVAIELSAEAKFRYEQISGPDRLFVDIENCRLQVGQKAIVHRVKVGDELVQSVRMAQTQPNVTRVVLDLNGAFAYTVSELASPYRIIVEIRKQGATVVESAAAATVSAPPRPEPVKEVAVREVSAPPVREALSSPAPPAAPKPTTAAVVTPKPANPKPAARNSNGERSLTRILGLKLGRVVLDPGHGGHDFGTIGPGGLSEKELVLDIALRLAELIEDRLGSEVVFTRKDDTFIPLEERTAIANREKADLFLSIHANSSPYKNAAGAETYYLNFTSSKVDQEVAARENAGHGKSIHELGDLLQKIALSEKLEESKEFAAKVQNSLHLAVSRANPAGVRNRGVKKAPFVVLIGARMPSVLAEVGFISNPREETLFKKAEHRQKIAEALFKGISQYAETLSHYDVAVQSRKPASKLEDQN